MPGKSPRVPSYRLHKPSGLAVVRLNGRDIYLDEHDTEASHEQYERVVSEWLANGRQLPKKHTGIAIGQVQGLGYTVVELADAFLDFADAYYRRADGKPTNEPITFRQALRPLIDLYGRTPVAEFGPLALKAIRQRMLEARWCRTHINKQVSRIKTMIRWGVENELVPSEVHQALSTPILSKRNSS